MKKANPYPFLEQFSRQMGIPEENLVRAFEIENRYRDFITNEPDALRRRVLYSEMYALVHPLYQKKAALASAINPFDKIVRLFSRELTGRSVLDIGCGTGSFLLSLSRLLPHKRLVGMDTSANILPRTQSGPEFMEGNVVEWVSESKFDVVFSHHVMEHIHKADLTTHLQSIKRALLPGGTLIIVMPNRLFGPSDVTRILDCAYTNSTPARGSHLNEMSYNETLALLNDHGFCDFKTVMPFPKIKYLVPFLRINPAPVAWIERSTILMWLLHHIKFRCQCIARFDVILISRLRTS